MTSTDTAKTTITGAAYTHRKFDAVYAAVAAEAGHRPVMAIRRPRSVPSGVPAHVMIVSTTVDDEKWVRQIIDTMEALVIQSDIARITKELGK